MELASLAQQHYHSLVRTSLAHIDMNHHIDKFPFYKKIVFEIGFDICAYFRSYIDIYVFAMASRLNASQASIVDWSFTVLTNKVRWTNT